LRKQNHFPHWQCCARLGNLFHNFPLRSAGRLNTVCDSAGSFDKASDRKSRSALDLQTAQVARYVGREETGESAVFQVDAEPTVASDSRTLKDHRKKLCFADFTGQISNRTFEISAEFNRAVLVRTGISV
jgi:hypothetical protein